MKNSGTILKSKDKGTAFTRYYFYITAFISGAVIMILELLGTRIFAPYFGTSLYVWSALIAVTLASLAIGYWIGGLVADRVPRADFLYFIILGSALAIWPIPRLAPFFMILTNNLGLRLGILSSATLLFTIPLVFLGAIPPYIIRLRASHLGNLGITAGGIYALSTVGSLIGTLLTGFILIPNFGIRNIFHFVTLILLILCLGWFMKSRKVVMSLIILFITVTVGLSRDLPKNQTESRIVEQVDSPYGRLKVVEINDKRYLLLNAYFQGEIDGQIMKGAFYAEDIRRLPLYRPLGETALMVGLGVGTMPRVLANFGIKTDVVEINPKMLNIAKKYFFYKPTGEDYIQDGRYFIRNCNKKYDFVIFDAYGGGSVPFHLLSLEAFEEVSNVLSRDGILCLVTVGPIKGEKSVASKSIYKTLRAVFPYVHIYYRSDINTFFASKEPLVDIDSQEISKEFSKSAQQEGIISTDDHNPMEFLQTRIDEDERNWNLKTFGHRILVR